MEIANPIYDVVFKYLMEDSRVAKLFLSAVTDLNIVSLEFLPQELIAGNNKSKKNRKSTATALNLSIYRLDFSARILEANGNEKVIIIEIQKSKFTHEDIRFRRYLGKQYMNANLYQWVAEASGRRYKSGLPILPIYILGEQVEGFEDIPVIHVDRCIRDRHTGQVLDVHNQFIESLFHQGIIINVPALNQKRRDELEQLLSIFDQSNRQENHHIMNVKESDFPERFRPIIRRLQAAIQEDEIRDIMTAEDEIIAQLNEYENRIAEADKQKEEALRKEEEALRKEEEALRKEEEALRKEEEALRKEEEALRKQTEAIRLLLSVGISKEEIAQKLGLDLKDITSL
ncbi:MAG TPA: hypothetical protein PKA00_01220 [Saprospiraceae bacterium]|nr:hypothetical protein [Saprospiraceae bacterium]HMQ81488.1 hypothetical protein [Saprospiraceae bacterium]